MSNQYYAKPAKVPFDIVGSWNRDTFSEINPEETVNMYILAPSSKNTHAAMVQVPGMRPVLSFPEGVTAGRKQYTHKDLMFCVLDDIVFMVSASLNPIRIGQIATTSGQVGISSNDADQVIFVDGAGGWIYSIRTNTFSQITDPNFPVGTKSVDTLNNYFICFVGDGDSSQWQASALNDGTSWPIDNIGFIQSRPDVGVAVACIKRLILLMGQISTETWINPPTGNPIAPNFPFVRDDNTLFEYGCASIGSVVQGLDALFWMSFDEDGPSYIMYCDGSQPRRISTPEIENVINSLPNFQDATAFIYKMNGHEFYQINFTEGDVSFLFDLTTQLWFRVGDKKGNSQYTRHPAQSHAYYNGKHYCLSFEDNKLYELDQYYPYYNETPLVVQRITSRLFDDSYSSIRVSMMQLVLLVKNVPSSGEFSDPFVSIEVSVNRGANWQNVQNIPIGKTGQFIHRIQANRFGVAQEMVFRVTCYFPVQFAIIDASMYYDVVGN